MENRSTAQCGDLMPRPARVVLWNDSQIDIAMRVVLDAYFKVRLSSIGIASSQFSLR